MKRHIFSNIALALLLLAPVFVSCSDDDDSQSTPMSIEAIYLEDVDAEDGVTDRLVTYARLGSLLRIQGSGFKGLKYIYVNGYETYFNNALMTNNNVWVTLDTDTPIEDADDDVRNTIQFVKDATSLTYEFTIRAASPSVTRIDNTLPDAGETVIVYGSNLHETESITLPDGTTITSGIEVSEDGDWYSFTMPSGVGSTSGSITSEGAHGTAMSPPYFQFNDCYVIDFDGLGDFGSWSATYSEDDLEEDPLGTSRGTVCMVVPQSKLDDGGVSAGVSSISGFWTAGNDSELDDWNRMTAYIDGSTDVSEVALQFDAYVPEDWDLTGQVEITIQNNLSSYGYGSSSTIYNSSYYSQAWVWVPWLDEDTGDHEAFNTNGRWETITVPLNKFGDYTNDDYSWTFQDVIDDKNAGSYRNFGIIFCNPDLEYSDDITYASSTFCQEVYLDRFRIVPCQTITVSDY